MAGIKIERIFLEKPHALLRHTSTTENPPWKPKELVLWTSSDPSNPSPGCTTYHADDSTALWIELLLDEASSSEPFEIIGHPAYADSTSSYRPYFEGQVQDKSHVDEKGHLKVKVPMKLDQNWKDFDIAPWRITQIDWWYCSNSAERLSLATTNVDIYGITADLVGFYKTYGVPIKLLELFCPANSFCLRKDWNERAVRKCHASTHDPEIKEDAIHSFRYNVESAGLSYYQANHGSTFALDAWLDNRAEMIDHPNRSYRVNCYDQSGLLQTVLHLSTPYHFVDPTTKEVTKLKNVGAIYKAPFGFINTLDLVGWGLCNNPFFKTAFGHKTNQITPDGYEDAEYPRSKFRNHKWVYLRASNGNKLENFNCADACALKPEATEMVVPLDKYLKAAIDEDPTREVFEDFVLQDFEIYDGVVNLERHPVNVWDRVDEYETKLQTEKFYQELTSHAKAAFGFPKPIETIRTVSIPDMFNYLTSEVQARIQSQLSVEQKKNVEEIVDVEKNTVDVGAEGSHFAVNYWRSDQLQYAPYLSFSVDVLKNIDLAIKHGVHAAYSLDGYAVNKSIDDDFVLWGNDPTRAQVAIFIYGNLVIQLSGNLSAADLENYVEVLKIFITKSRQGPPVNMFDLSQVKDNCPKSVKFNERFVVEIWAPNTANIDAQYRNEKIRDLNKPQQDPKDPTHWTIPSVARKSEATDDTLIIAFADATTYAPATKSINIAVMP